MFATKTFFAIVVVAAVATSSASVVKTSPTDVADAWSGHADAKTWKDVATETFRDDSEYHFHPFNVHLIGLTLKGSSFRSNL